MGDLRPVEGHPAFAAAQRLDLDELALAKVQEISTARAVVLDRIVIDNLASLNNWVVGVRSTDAAERRQAIAEVMRVLEPLREQPDPAAAIREVLPTDQISRFDAMLTQHESDLQEQARSRAESRGAPFRPAAYQIQRDLEILGHEVRASYDRAITSLADELDEFLERASLSPEGEGLLRSSLTEFTQMTGFRPSPAQRRSYFVRLLRELDPADRAALVRALREQRFAG